MKRFLILFVALVVVIGADAKQKDKRHKGRIASSAILSPEQKVFGLSKFWQEVNYNFVYFDRVDRAAWDSTYMALIPAVQKTSNDWEYYRLLQRFCAMLDDGHTYIYRPSIPMDQTATEDPDTVFLPERDGLFEQGRVYIEEIDDKIYVTRVNKNLAPTLPVRSEIVEVNGLPVEEYIEKFTLPYVGQSTDYKRRYSSIYKITSGIYGEQLTLSIRKPDGAFADVELTFGGESFDFPEGYDDFPDIEFSNELVELKWYDDVACIALNSFADNTAIAEFEKLLPEIRRAKGLVIDLRGNGGGSGSVSAAIVEYLTPDSLLHMSRSRTRQNVAAYKAGGRYVVANDTISSPENRQNFLAAQDRLYLDLGADVWPVKVPVNERIVVPTAILMGSYTASAAEDFLIMVDNQPHVTTVGQRSAGSTGQPWSVELIAGIGAEICTKDDTYPDGRTFVGIGIIPDIEVPLPTMAEMESGEDTVLKIALQLFEYE
jgi:C-terminal processing protease CtpA/Prc